MQTITIKCKVISPMFSGNATKDASELRPSAFIGSLRFWWRAVHPNLTAAELKRQEIIFFGGRLDDKNHKKPSFRFLEIVPIRILLKKDVQLDVRNGVNRGKATAIMPNSTFAIKLLIIENEEKVIALFKLASALGSIGKRSRRGAGAWKIEEIEKDENNRTNITYDSEHINRWIATLNNNYQSNTNVPKFPYLKEFVIGNIAYKNTDDLRRKIMRIAHDLKNKRYFASYLGNTQNGRLASPVFVSMIEFDDNHIKKVKPIITRLGLENIENREGILLQDEFINTIINN